MAEVYIDGKSFDVVDVEQWEGMYEPPVAPLSTARIYFDFLTNRLKLSENVGPYQDLSGYVPYTGATQDVDLGEYSLKSSLIQLYPTSQPTGVNGVIYYDNTENKFKFYQNGSWVYLGSGGGGLPSGTSGQTLRHNGTNWVATSFLYNSGSAIGVNTTTPGAKLDIVPSTSSDVVFRTKSLQSIAPLGSELVSNGSFSTVPDTSWTWGTGWTHDTTNLEADHTTGNTAALTQSISVTNGQTYQVTFTIKNRTTGSVTIDVNGVYIYNYGTSNTFSSNGTYSRSFVANITGSATLSITPTSDFNGSIDDVSVKQITDVSQPNFSLLDDANSVMAELRGKSSLNNLGLGVGALRYNTAGNYNTAVGNSALYSNTTGYSNSAIGNSALYSNTTGYQNTAIGTIALRSNTTGINNTAIGNNALYSNTTGNYNVAIGSSALYSSTTGNYNVAMGHATLYSNTTGSQNTAIGYYALTSNTGNYNVAIGSSALYSSTTGYQNTAIGMNAGRYIADGSTANQTSNKSVYIGYDTRALADGDTNEIVIGVSVIGAGSNSVVLGNDSITKTILKGNVGVGTTSPNYKCHIVGTFGFNPGSSVTPANNGDVVIELTSNTQLTFKAKGSDGVVRSASLTLA